MVNVDKIGNCLEKREQKTNKLMTGWKSDLTDAYSKIGAIVGEAGGSHHSFPTRFTAATEQIPLLAFLFHR